MRNWFHVGCVVFPLTVLSLHLARGCLYGGRGPRSSWPWGGCWWCVHRAPSPTVGRDGGADRRRVPLLLSLQGLSTDVVVLFPVFVLAKWATVSGCVTAAAGFTCFTATIPATLAGILLLIDDSERVLCRLPLGLCDCALHLCTLCRNHVVGFPLSFRHGLLQLSHRLALHLINSLLCMPGRSNRTREHFSVSAGPWILTAVKENSIEQAWLPSQFLGSSGCLKNSRFLKVI